MFEASPPNLWEAFLSANEANVSCGILLVLQVFVYDSFYHVFTITSENYAEDLESITQRNHNVNYNLSKNRNPGISKKSMFAVFST